MKAALFKEINTPLRLEEVAKPVPSTGQVLVKLKAAALNHRDLWIQTEQQSVQGPGIILGSDGCGMVEEVGDEADESLIGREVVINPSLGWGKNPAVQSDAFKILGFPDAGTFSEYIALSGKQVAEKPQHLLSMEAAALPLSALTAYRALFTKARLRPGEKVLITGIGGGAALWALKMAVAFQAKVFITSGSPMKLTKALELGALSGFNYKDSDWVSSLNKAAGGIDVVIDSAGGEQFSQLLDLVVPGGRIVNFGRTAGNIQNLSTRTLYWKQISILGTTMGHADEFLSMLDFVHKHKIKPVIDKVFEFHEINEAFGRMKNGDQFGKIVLRISS
jgi:zinc-binding alcohol dehydrogenase/oxidoreductase